MKRKEKWIMPRLIAAVLSAAMLVGTLAGCSEKTDEGETKQTNTANPTVGSATTGEEETKQDPAANYLQDNLGEYDFEGHVYLVGTGIHGTYPVSTFSVEDAAADVMDESLYKRNIQIEDRFNIEFAEEVFPDIFNINELVKQIVAADTREYDMLMQIDRFACVSAINGYLLNYYDLPKIDLSREYWYQNLINDLTVHGCLFFAAGYDNLVYTTSVTHLLFNQNLITQYNLDDPFELVRNGVWTNDRFFEMCEVATNDLNGDGKWTDTDGYGVVEVNNMFWTNFWIADDVKLVDKDEEGDLFYNALNNEKFYNVSQYLSRKTNGNHLVFEVGGKIPITTYKTDGSAYNLAMSMFMGGNVMFCAASLITLLDARGMEDDFGIIPYPRSEEVAAGTSYNSRTFGGFPYVVPSNKNDAEKERTSVIMEALACASYNLVKPALFDKVFRGKVSRNPDSVEMMEMIIENRVTDLGETYLFDYVEAPIEAIFAAGDAMNVASKTASLEKQATKMIGKYNDAFRELYERRNEG